MIDILKMETVFKKVSLLDDYTDDEIINLALDCFFKSELLLDRLLDILRTSVDRVSKLIAKNNRIFY